MVFKLIFKEILEKKIVFKLCMKVFVDDNKKIIESGNVLFSNLKLSGENHALYYFDKKGSEGHFDKSGKSVQKALMKTQ